ncbi:rod-determining factor RdfA [Halapricum desulfuricans]|uniref:rod-determining factor RdfA n=1 Tax=Halapricum desulfuricans TaxID=2841257 RepID=UPI001E5C64DF|nr:rod-determining factor RdfA [Halapricum desulfuricans]
MGSHEPRTDGGKSRSKVAQVIEAYDLDGVGDELEQRWLATGEDGMSLRELADHFNRIVLEAAIERSEMSVLDVDIDRLYEQLTGDDVSGGVRTRTQRRLERNGIDVESVTGNFVTHQTIHTYLREYRDVEQPEPTPQQRRESALERIQKLQNRSAAVTQDAIEGLQRAELVPEGDVDVVVDIQVIYTDTGEQFDIFDLIEGDSE